MKTIAVDFSKTLGPVKPMHAVNNGPVYKFAVDQRITNLDAFKAAGIPYARTHDASFYATYGGEHTVDVNAIFPCFDSDPNDPASYDFCLTDEYLRVMELADVKPFYRLGSKIEHWKKKYNTLPPKDFHKWAVICEHIIRHFNEGWADGYHMNIEYWEIWNEPDLDPDDSTNKRCWGGTQKEFFELYDIAARHLKGRFPHLKIGGPALACNLDWADAFLAQLTAPLDFFSWHIYASTPFAVLHRAEAVRALLDKHGYQNTESILNEWNYVRGWTNDDWLYSLKTEKGLKGASFTTAVMCACQYKSPDMLMYYDARPCAMNGLFCTDWVCECLKGYYPFLMFHTLYELGHAVEAICSGGDIYACAASKEGECALLLTYYTDDDGAQPTVTVTLDLNHVKQGAKCSYYLLDEGHDMALWKEEAYTRSVTMDVGLHSSILIKIKE